MPGVELRVTDRFAYREAVPEGEVTGEPVLLVHGFPESSLMWEPVMAPLAAAGRRCIAPDLYCLGDSPDAGAATFERNRETLATFLRYSHEQGLSKERLTPEQLFASQTLESFKI